MVQEEPFSVAAEPSVAQNGCRPPTAAAYCLLPTAYCLLLAAGCCFPPSATADWMLWGVTAWLIAVS
jgi:hypothetical protein